jgi:uncharacterized membrane-anchored protein
MKFPTRHRPSSALPGLTGTARVDHRARSLAARLARGDIAVLDQLDLDRATAQEMADAQVAAVVNASKFVSGRYPTQGPGLLLQAGVVLVEEAGPSVLRAVRDGQPVRLRDGVLIIGEQEVARGTVLDEAALRADLEAARSGLAGQLDSLTHNSTEFLRREQDLLLHGKGAPRLNTRLTGRPVVVVAGGPEHAAELASIRRYLREQRPVLVGVDAGAEALKASGRKPDIVVLSSPRTADTVDRVSAGVLRAARDVVVLVDRGAGTTPLPSLDRLGVRPHRLETGATAEDAALILASLGEASLIVAVGVHASLQEFLDRRRGGQASAFLTRLRIGPELVDARSVPQLYSGRLRAWQLWLAVLAGLLAVLAAIAVTPVGQEWLDDVWPHVRDLFGGNLP